MVEENTKTHDELLKEFNIANNIKLSVCKTYFIYTLNNVIENIHIKGETNPASINEVVLYAPKFKHREFTCKIKDGSNKEQAIANGVSDFDDKFIEKNYNAFYNAFKNYDDILKISLNEKFFAITDETFIDNILDKDIQNIITAYITNFFY